MREAYRPQGLPKAEIGQVRLSSLQYYSTRVPRRPRYLWRRHDMAENLFCSYGPWRARPIRNSPGVDGRFGTVRKGARMYARYVSPRSWAPRGSKMRQGADLVYVCDSVAPESEPSSDDKAKSFFILFFNLHLYHEAEA